MKILIVGSSLVIISGCAAKTAAVPNIISVGDCERGIVTDSNVKSVQGLWPKAQVTDVLISGGCYQDHFIKKR